jgi:hypothetical protein
MAAENIDNTINGTGLFPAKVPGLSDAADIQAALRLYHYGSYAYDGANTNPANLLNPSIAKHLQNLVDADAAEIVNRNAAIAVETTNRNTAISNHNTATTNVHGIPNTANLATQQFVTTAITGAISGAVGGYPDLAGTAIDWNSVDERFDVEPRLANAGTIVTKSENFTLSPEDVGKTILINSSLPISVVLPANASVSIPVGYAVDIIQTGTGSVTVSEGTVNVSINSKASIKSLDGQYSKGTLVKIDTNTWFFFGNLLNVVVPTPSPTPVAPTPIPTTPVAPVPVPAVPVAPVPVPAVPVAPEPTPVVTPVVQPTTPVVQTPTLATPSLSVTSQGWNTYPNAAYANITVGNYDYNNTYTSSLGTQNPEFPEEWNLSNLNPNQSYTVYITASRAGYTSAQGSVTFSANPMTAPTPVVTPVTPTVTAYYVSGCCSNSGPGGTPGLVKGSSNVSFANALDSMEGFCVTGVISNTLQSNSDYPAQNCSVTPTPAVTPTVGTTYWATGCCEGSFGGYQVTGTSPVNSQAAVNAMNSNCSEPGYGVPDYSTGSYTTTSNIPTNACSTATPVPVVPVPVPAAPVAPTPVVVVIPGTMYLSYCDVGGVPVQDAVTIDGSNFISWNINTACADYRNLLEFGGATNIQCSIVSPPSAPLCGAAPTPVPTPVPVAPVAPVPAPTAPTPVPVVASTTIWHAVCFSDGGTLGPDSSTVPSILYSDCNGYREFVLGIDPGASINCSASGPVSLPGCVAPTPAPVAPSPSPAPVTPVPSSPNYPALKSGWNQCTSGDAPNPAASQCNYNNIGTCVQNGSSGASCTAPVAPAPVTPTPVPVAPVAPVATPTLDCTTCTGYSGLAGTEVQNCSDGCGTRTLCRTQLGCANYYLNECLGCGAVPTPSPVAPTPAASCTPNCVFDGYTCNGWTAIYYYRDANGCGSCPNVEDPYGCA